MKRTAIAIAVGALSAGLSHGLIAQETQDEESQAEVRVEEEAADVDVEQQPAEVQVEQEPPDVTVEQQPPEVTIEQQDPNVDVEQAEPNVTVEQQGEADVEVERAEEAEAELRDSDEEQKQEERDQESDEQATQGDDLMSMEVSELQGQTVFSRDDDEEIGEIERVVRDTESNETFVVISEGGFLGFGEDEMGYPIDELEIRNEGELVVQSSDSGESGDYSSDRYEDIDENQTLREATQGN